MKNACWYKDYFRTTDDKDFVWSHFIKDFLFQHRLKYMVYFRTAQNTKSKLVKLFCEYRLFVLCRKYGIEIKTATKIGEGFVMCHPYNITISPNAVLGRNINIMKGATIGLSGGKKPGAPTLGDCVFVGLNSTVLGGIQIGDDVMIAPNTFVNQDVPSHSVVVGNPCNIIPKENATGQYIYHRV
jgi:serine O-acetyltransferase